MSSIDARQGGPSLAVREMSKYLAQQGHEVTILAHNDASNVADMQSVDGYRVLRFPLTLKRWQYSREYHKWFKDHLPDYDAVVITSLFLGHTFFTARLCRRKSIQYAMRPHGSLNHADIEQSHAYAKRMYIRTIERQSLRAASFVFCTSEREAQEAAEAVPGINTVVIPLGVNWDVLPTESERRPDRSRILFLGRLTQKKGVDLLITAMRSLALTHNDADLRIVGPDNEGLAKPYERLAETEGVSRRTAFVGFAGPDQRKLELAQAGVFALPSADENFGISVAEALASGLPVLVTPGVSHAQDVAAWRAGVVVERDTEAISAGLDYLLSLTQADYKALSANARNLARSKFHWDSTARSLVNAFSEGLE